MGITQVTAAVRNPADPSRFWEGLFLVDTRAVDCMAPVKYLREICLTPRAHRTYALADGWEVTFDVAFAEVEFMCDRIAANIIFGPDDAEPILGSLALQSVGIEVDARNGKLNRRHALRLKRLGRQTCTC